jgi:transcriptional regulator with XRE-family HTH domain
MPNSPPPSDIRDQLRELVAASGRSIGAIARGLDPPMSQQHLSAILSGRIASPSVETVERILAGLGCRLAIVRR